MKILCLRVAWWFAAIAVIGPGAAGLKAHGQPPGGFDTIAYRDSGGFTGGGTGKILSLSSDGRLEATMRGGQRTVMQLRPDELAALSAAVAAVDWPHVEHAYQARGAADLVVRDLTVVVRGTTYATHADSLAKLPPSLRALFDRLDDFYDRATKPSK